MKYRSTLIAHRLRIEAVHSKTSDIVQMSHRIAPKYHLLFSLSSTYKAYGITSTPTKRSLTAKLTIKKLLALSCVCSLRTIITAIITNEFPTRQEIIIDKHIAVRKTRLKVSVIGVVDKCSDSFEYFEIRSSDSKMFVALSKFSSA